MTFGYHSKSTSTPLICRCCPRRLAETSVILISSLDALAELLRDTSWPESRQGEFLGYVTRDVYEFACAIRSEAAADRWTVAASLIRPLQDTVRVRGRGGCRSWFC